MKKGYKFDRALTRPGGKGHPFYGGGRPRVDPDGETATEVLRFKVTPSMKAVILAAAERWYGRSYSDLTRTAVFQYILQRQHDEENAEYPDQRHIGDRMEDVDAPPSHRYWCEVCQMAFYADEFADWLPCPSCEGKGHLDDIPF